MDEQFLILQIVMLLNRSKKTIENGPIAASELDYLLLHQANIRILDKMAKKIGVDRDKLPANMMEYGNTSAASIPIFALRVCGEWHDSFRW